jgi:hypothetical protein
MQGLGSASSAAAAAKLHALGIAERLERALLMGTGIIGTDQREARAVLRVIQGWAPERLRIVAQELRQAPRHLSALTAPWTALDTSNVSP